MGRITDENSLGRDCFRSGAEPPDDASGEDQENGDQLGAAHEAAENDAASGVAAEKLQQEAGDAIKDQICGEDLAIELFALDHPGKQEEIGQLDGGLEKLRGLQGATEGRFRNAGCQRIGKSDSPEMIGRFAEAAAGGETADASDGVAESKPGRECIADAERGNLVTMDVPCGGGEGSDEAAGEDAPCLQGVEAEYLARIGDVPAEIHEDIKNFRSDNAGENDRDAEVPGVVRVNSLAFRKLYADPEADKDAKRDEKTIGRRAETSDMKECGKHLFNWMQGAGNLHLAV